MADAAEDVTHVPRAIRPDEIRQALPDLRAQCQRAIDAAESFRDAAKAVAARAGIEPAALTAYVRAVVTDKLKAQKTRAEQMTLLLEEFG